MKKILIIRFSSLGDVILSTSVLDPLFKGGFSIDFLTFAPFSDIFKYDYRIKKLLSVNKKQLSSLKDIKTFSKTMKQYDYILDLHNNLRTYLLSFFSGKKFIKYKKKSLKRRLFTTPIGKQFLDLSNFNVLKAYQEPLKKLGIELPNIQRPSVILNEEEKVAVKKFLPESFIVIGTGARYKNKIYPFFDKVSYLLKKEGFNVVLIGSKEDKDRDTVRYSEGVIDLRGKLSLRESLAVVSLSSLVISNDSAVAHMGRALSIPVLMIYGATHPYFGFAPLPEEGDFIVKNLPCQPCDLHGKKPCKYEEPKCLYSTPPEEVFKKVLELKNGV